MAAKSCGARSVHDIGERVGLDDAEFNEKVVSRPQGNLVIFLVGIEIKKGVSGIFEFHEITTIALFTVAFGKALGEFEGDHAIGLCMKDEAGRESLLRKTIGGAVKFTIFRGDEAIVANPFPRGVAYGAEENHCAWLGRRSEGVIVGVKGRAKNGVAPALAPTATILSASIPMSEACRLKNESASLASAIASSGEPSKRAFVRYSTVTATIPRDAK